MLPKIILISYAINFKSSQSLIWRILISIPTQKSNNLINPKEKSI